MIHVEGMDAERQRIADEGWDEPERTAPKYRRMTVAERRAYIARALKPYPVALCWCGRKRGHNGTHRGAANAKAVSA